MNEPVWTHDGWMLLCPVKMTDPDRADPIVAARWGFLEPWLTLQHWAQIGMIWMLSLMDPNYEPAFMFRITGERARN